MIRIIVAEWYRICTHIRDGVRVLVESQHRTSVKVVVSILTLLFVGLGVLNFIAQWNSDVRTDGVRWIFSSGALIADDVPLESAGAVAGIEAGDRLRSINFRSVLLPQDVGRVIQANGESGRPLQYEVMRGNETFVKLVIPLKRPNNFYFYLAVVGFVILGIGVFAFLRSRSRAFALHFYMLCLAFFGTYVFSPTGKLDHLDWFFFWADEVFLLTLPPLFLHFAFYFPGQRESIPRDKLPFLYLPSMFLIAARIIFTLFYYFWPQTTVIPTIEGYLTFENVELSWLFLGLLAGVVVLFLSYARCDNVIQRKQLKLVLAGMVWGFGPYALCWLVSLAIQVPQWVLQTALVPQILIPISLTYALFRYRLMDVDIIIKRGMIYTLTTLTLFVLYLFLTIAWVRFLLPQASRATTATVGSLTTLLATLLFPPLRDRVRALVDRFYYKDSYDYRRTLIQFSHEIASSLDIGQMGESLLKHIKSTFKIESSDLLLKVALNKFESVSDPNTSVNPGLGFLTRLSTDHFLFVDSLEEPDPDLVDDSEVLRRLKSHYFIPCKFKHNIVAILCLSKKDKGDYLSSEDLDLLQTLAGQLAIVIENHRLFFTLKTKADELERVKKFNENILLSLSVGIVTLDQDGVVVACNNSIESFLGLSRVEILGRSLESLFPPEIVDRYHNYNLKTARRKLEGSRFYKTLVEDFVQKDFVMNLSFVPLINESDVEYGTILILDDVTHQAKLEEQLSQSEKLSALGLLAAGVAHEVNTPLTGISSYTQMLEQQLSRDTETCEILQKIEQQTFRASKIISTLLDLSREQPAPMTLIDLNNLIRDTLVLLRPHFKDLPIEVVQQLDPSNPCIDGNEGKLQQVFTNLFLNAKDAMPEGGRLLVSTESEGDEVVIDIVDTGVGINEKALKHIYEPFFTTKKGMRGTGLGLAISYTIIQEHKGVIDVFSEEGRGTHFQIRLMKAKKGAHERSRAYSGD